MCTPAKIKKLDEVVVNRIAAGEVIQRPANALKELIENSLDAKATNIQITTKEGGLKLLQIQDNGTGIRKDDMDIVCERFTTSKLQNFEDLNKLTTYGFRGEALASISHVALLTIITKTASEKCAYKATYLNSKLKASPTACAGNQGTIIMIENLFYNVVTRRKALSNPSEEFTKITEVVMRYAIHNPTVGFTLKKHGEASSQVRTPHDSTKQNNIKILYGNIVARELLEIELNDESYKFKMHGLITNPSYTNKRMIMLLFINNRLVDSSSIRKMLEEVYSIYLPKKDHPWCYLSLDIDPQNIDVNVHPTKHEVRFLHEDAIIERIKIVLDEKLAGNSASRTFYLQARLPKADITKEVLDEVLPNHGKEYSDKSKRIYAKEMVRTDSSDQKLDKFNFTMHSTVTHDKDNTCIEKSTNELQPEILNSEVTLEKSSVDNKCQEKPDDFNLNINIAKCDTPLDTKKPVINNSQICWSDIMNEMTASNTSEFSQNTSNKIISIQNEKPEDIPSKDVHNTSSASEYDLDKTTDDIEDKTRDVIADKARKQVYQYFGNKDIIDNRKKSSEKEEELNILENIHSDKKEGESSEIVVNKSPDVLSLQGNSTTDENKESTTDENKESTTDENKESATQFKSYSVNDFKHEIKLTSILKLRKEVEEECHEGLREILANLTFVGCIDQTSAIIQSGVNLYICNTTKLAEELFYEIMLYDFANFGIIKFSERISLFDLAMIALDAGETGWTEEDGPKEELASNVKELLLEKADMLNEYCSIVIDKLGNLKSLPVLLDKYFPYEAEIPLYIMRLATEVDWRKEQQCFKNICRETAKFYSYVNPKHQEYDWKHITEHVLYPAIKESLLPPKHFVHDSTILQIANLPDLYKVFERC